MRIWRCVLAGGVQRSSLSVKRTVPAFTGAEASATACLSHGRGICFYRVSDYQIAPLPPQGGKGRCARWAQDIIACDAAERIIFAIVAGSGSGKLCRHSRGNDNDQENAGYVRESGQRRTGVAREGFLDRRSKRCFWLLLSPQTKVARAGARNYPRRRQIMRLRRCAATPHPPPSGAPSPQGEGLGLCGLGTRLPVTSSGGMLGGAAVGAKNVYRGWGKRPRQPPRR